MISELFGLLRKKFLETNVPWERSSIRPIWSRRTSEQGQYEMQGPIGANRGYQSRANGVLKMIKQEILDGTRKNRVPCGALICMLSAWAAADISRYMRRHPF
jgi:hypothetical protein